MVAAGLVCEVGTKNNGKHKYEYEYDWIELIVLLEQNSKVE